jgi:hypothetical protein
MTGAKKPYADQSVADKDLTKRAGMTTPRGGLSISSGLQGATTPRSGGLAANIFKKAAES